MTDKPFSPASERNRQPILAVLREHFADRRRVLEIGSGTGQHAVHFAAALPSLIWQCSDRAENLPGIRAWLEDAGLTNTPAPIELDVASPSWRLPSLAPPLGANGQVQDQERPHPAYGRLLPQAGEVRRLVSQAGRFDAAFSANTFHIMGWGEVEAFFAGLGHALEDDATVVVYGPFNEGGAFTSDSNRVFDASLKARDARMGIRDVEAVVALAQAIGLRLVDDVAMPANNRCLVWRRARNATASA